MPTYYVDMAVGNDGNLGTSEGAGNAWKTLGKTQTAPIAAGDKVYVKGSADYTETLTIAVVGTAAAPVVFEGYTGSPGDGGMATVNGAAARATGLTPAAGSNFHVFKNFRFTDHTGVGAGNLSGDYFTYKKCRFDNNGGDGLNADQSCLFEGCYAHNNGGDGFDVGHTTAFICCISNANTANGFGSEGGTFYKCMAFSNGGVGFYTQLNTYHIFIDCVADGDAKDTNEGYDLSVAYTSAQLVVVNCVAYDCTAGFVSNASLNTERSISRNNLVNANTTPYTNFQTFTGEVTAAPAFVSEATQDYTPDVGSPLIGAGFGLETNAWITQTGDASDIGAMDEVGGGGPTDYPVETDVRDLVDYNFGTQTGELIVPVVTDVRLGVDVDTPATHGTLIVPGPTDVRDGIGTDATVGSCHVPAVGDVRFGVDVDAATGLCYVPVATDVRFGVDVDATTGLCKVPAATDVRDTVPVDAGTGSLIVPAVTDVRLGVDVDTPATHGTLIVPAVGDVRLGVDVDTAATHGTLIVPAVVDVRLGTDVDTPAIHGTLILPVPANVRAGVFYDDGIVVGTLVAGGGASGVGLKSGGNL
jgi:hypothetical protein